MTTISENYKNVSQRMSDCARRSGRNPDEITLLAVSKTVGADSVSSAWHAGVRIFGENRVQEIQQKFNPRPHPNIEVHMIGHLQSNKAKTAVHLVDWIQSVDSEKILRLISKEAERNTRKINICIEVNTSAEDSKYGLLHKSDLLHLSALALTLPGVELRGLMTIGPLRSKGDEALRQAFVRLRGLFLEIQQEIAPPRWDTLSMGMSNDFDMAIEEGATMLRIGTSIFGKRN